MASSTAAAISKASQAANIAARAIHVKIHPTARTIAERREVLRVLEGFGEVEMFKSLKYDPSTPVSNAFLSILSTTEAARAAIEASPIRYRLITASATPSLSSSSASSSEAPSTTSPNAEDPESALIPAQEESHYELRISPSTYPHTSTPALSPLHGPYKPVLPRRSPIAADLNERVPFGIMRAGLCDWVTDSMKAGGTGVGVGVGRRGAAGAWDGEDGYEAGSADRGTSEGKGLAEWGRGGGMDTVPWRLRDRERKKKESKTPDVMRGLRGLRTKDEEGG